MIENIVGKICNFSYYKFAAFRYIAFNKKISRFKMGVNAERNMVDINTNISNLKCY